MITPLTGGAFRWGGLELRPRQRTISARSQRLTRAVTAVREHPGTARILVLASIALLTVVAGAVYSAGASSDEASGEASKTSETALQQVISGSGAVPGWVWWLIPWYRDGVQPSDATPEPGHSEPTTTPTSRPKEPTNTPEDPALAPPPSATTAPHTPTATPTLPATASATPSATATPTFTATPTITPTPTPSPTATPTVTPTPTPPPPTATLTPIAEPPSTATRDKYRQPFASTSIWNMPIGSGARYVPAGIPPAVHLHADEDVLVLRPEAPLTEVWTYSSDSWSRPLQNRCTATNNTGLRVPFPTNFILPDEAPDSPNSSGAILAQDGRTLVQFQPVTRCNSGGRITYQQGARYADEDIYGPGIRGAHGGAGLSSIGGTIRLGEMSVAGSTIPHALKLNLDCGRVCYKGVSLSDSFRWPATTADACAPGCYGGSNPALRMGALLALAPDFNVNALETEPGRILARTLIDYGAYLVDSTAWDAYAWSTERSPDGRFIDEFRQRWGFSWDVNNNTSSPWGRDNVAIISALQVVDNNSAGTIGGGGTPRRPLAPPIGN
jgi:cell division protein FtsN